MNYSYVVLVGFFTFFASSSMANDLGTLKRSLNDKPYGYLTIDDPTGSAPSQTVQRFEVRAGDCSSNFGWSDCDNDRERSELSSSTISGEKWVHWSIYLPSDYPIIYPVKTALGQFHQKRGHVVWMFQNHAGGYEVDNQTIGTTLHKQKILSDEEMRGKWNDILVHVKWSSGDNGFFHVYVNGETKPRYFWFGKTQSSGKQVYFKYGIYRSFMTRREGPEPTQVVLYADVTASDECSEVAKRFDCPKITAGISDLVIENKNRQNLVEKARQSQGKVLTGQKAKADAACQDPVFAKMLPEKCGQ